MVTAVTPGASGSSIVPRANSGEPILWATEGLIDEVKIGFTDDGRATWSSVTDGTPNDFVYEWTVPETGCQPSCELRVCDVEGPSCAFGAPFWIGGGPGVPALSPLVKLALVLLLPRSALAAIRLTQTRCRV